MASQYSSDTELGLINGMNKASTPSDQPEQDQHSSGDDDTDGIVFIMKGIHETDQVSVFIVKGAHDTDQVSNHVPRGTKCGPETQPQHLQYVSGDVADVDTVNGVDDTDQVSNHAPGGTELHGPVDTEKPAAHAL